MLKSREIPKRGLVSGVPGGSYLFHADLVAECRALGFKGIDFVQAADQEGTPLAWFEIRIPRVLPPMTVESTGLSRGSTSGEVPCSRCGRDGWFGPTLESAGFQVIFPMPGMVLATVFVSLPLVIREVVPVV